MKLRFILSEVGKGLSRNRAMSVAVILVTFVSLLFVGIAGLTQMQVSKMKSEWYDKIEVTIYMCAINDAAANCNATEATDAQIDAVRQKLASAEMTPYVATVYEETKEEAYENFQRLNGTQPSRGPSFALASRRARDDFSRMARRGRAAFDQD